MALRKKAAGLFAAALAFACLFGCAKGADAPAFINPAEQLARPFESTVAVTYRGMEVQGRLARQAPGCCRFSFQSPKALESLSVEITTERVNLDYNGLHTSLAPGALPENAIPELLAGVLGAAARETGVDAVQKGGVFTLSGKVSGSEYELRLDAQSGDILSISVPKAQLEAVFSGFSYISGQEKPISEQPPTENS